MFDSAINTEYRRIFIDFRFFLINIVPRLGFQRYWQNESLAPLGSLEDGSH